jgi:hypothetical protein
MEHIKFNSLLNEMIGVVDLDFLREVLNRSNIVNINTVNFVADSVDPMEALSRYYVKDLSLTLKIILAFLNKNIFSNVKVILRNGLYCIECKYKHKTVIYDRRISIKLNGLINLPFGIKLVSIDDIVIYDYLEKELLYLDTNKDSLTTINNILVLTNFNNTDLSVEKIGHALEFMRVHELLNVFAEQDIN